MKFMYLILCLCLIGCATDNDSKDNNQPQDSIITHTFQDNQTKLEIEQQSSLVIFRLSGDDVLEARAEDPALKIHETVLLNYTRTRNSSNQPALEYQITAAELPERAEIFFGWGEQLHSQGVVYLRDTHQLIEVEP